MAPVAVPLATEPKAPANDVVKPLLTSGQHEPLFDILTPYEQFPKEVTGPTVWTKEEFESNPKAWKWRWTPEQIADLEAAYDEWEKTGKSLPEINRDSFPLANATRTFLAGIREHIVNGAGFALIQGLPTDNWSVVKSSAIYLAIGSVIGIPVSQNGKGHILGHVKDLGNDPTQIHKVRIYTTTARQYFHTDSGDIVGLLCLHRAKEGGESDVVSAHNLWNTLQKERPDVAELLAKPDWYFDRKGEVSDGQKEWVQQAVFYWHDGHLVSHYDPYYVRSITRFIEAGQIPGHSPAQLEAIEVLEATAQRLALHMILEVGDLQFVADTHVLHARTAYVDHLPPAPRRHLLRLWLATPESEGGWKRPFPDSAHIRRGGIQVNSQPHTCPLDAE
ncbi:Taurine hydroxylase-like protein SAT17 [Vanrija pseudolonga]|uniref:Taurine hydroxylase-like protein SAT17 n=1 Tax=Vanrija pseudolonga TaxID=143232 RepID=A0AAF0YCN0_9TREE|nr:Taurine hydroxylase-like protein SAT17 [Vanrija pseudolonga]